MSQEGAVQRIFDELKIKFQPKRVKYDITGNVVRLDLGACGIKSLPDGILNELTSLEWLYLDNNDLSSLPENIFADLTTLQRLWLQSNFIETLPSNLLHSQHRLQVLTLNTNKIKFLPSKIFDQLSLLQDLNLHFNDLTELPDGIFHSLSSLEHLWLDNNKIQVLQDGIFDGLESLQGLYLSNNYLKSIPFGIFTPLTELNELYLDNNRFYTIPEDSFLGLESLEGIYLGNNGIQELPENLFVGLKNLKEISLKQNDLSSLPLGIFRDLDSLNELDLDKTSLPPVLNQTLVGEKIKPALESYYKQIQEKKPTSVPINPNPIQEIVAVDETIGPQSPTYQRRALEALISRSIGTIPFRAIKTTLKIETNEELNQFLIGMDGIKINWEEEEIIANEAVFINSQILKSEPKVRRPTGNYQAKMCMICRSNSSYSDENPKVECWYCHTNYHFTHLMAYLRIKGQCPVCRERLEEDQYVEYKSFSS